MAVRICTRPKNSCKSCEYYKFDNDRNDYVCFMPPESTFEDYKQAIANNDLDAAKQIYNKIFKKSTD